MKPGPFDVVPTRRCRKDADKGFFVCGRQLREKPPDNLASQGGSKQRGRGHETNRERGGRWCLKNRIREEEGEQEESKRRGRDLTEGGRKGERGGRGREVAG